MCRALLLGLTLGLLSTPGTLAAEPIHWAFQKPRAVQPPSVQHKNWVQTPIDAFILARLEKAGLRPAPAADRATLLRRITFDLTGLPPTPEECAAFLADTRPDAYARVVDRLLASPHYGERWAQHWLDVARFAESNGYEVNADRLHAWRYRDYVVNAFNKDKPYDRFLTEQLAGDLLARGKNPRENQELLLAAGFNRCGQLHLVSGNIDPEEARQEVLTEMTGALGSVFLGLTLNCARCHDHKFDPIEQKDYFQLQAFFSSAQLKDVDLATAEEKAAYDRKANPLKEEMARLRQQVNAIDAPYRTRLVEAKKAALEPSYREALKLDPSKRTVQQQQLAAHAAILTKVTWDEILEALTPVDRERRTALRARMHALEAQLPPPPAQAWTLGGALLPATTHILKRGDVKRKGEKVDPAYPQFLVSAVAPPDQKPDRLALARWLTHPDHPLTARVMVNRLWQHHFGRGLVATPNDFGTRGAAPSHPELLDWLAREFVRSGWSIKHMHRLMVLSSTYQQRSQVRNPQAEKVDLANRWLWHMNRRRLEAEALRDGVLAVAGTLNPKVGGPSVRVPLEPEVYDLIFTEGEPDGLWLVTPDEKEHTRRTLYLFNKRNVRLPLLEAFDQPDTLNSCPVRPVSTFAPQALILLNGPFMQEQSKAFAARLLRENGAKPERLIDQAYQRALNRSPRRSERAFSLAFLSEQSEFLRDRLRARLPVQVPPSAEEIDPALAAALVDFCLALLNSNEFVYLP